MGYVVDKTDTKPSHAVLVSYVFFWLGEKHVLASWCQTKWMVAYTCLVRNLGVHHKALILENHGRLTMFLAVRYAECMPHFKCFSSEETSA